MFVENWVRNSAHGMLAIKAPVRIIFNEASWTWHQASIDGIKKDLPVFQEDDSHTSPPKCFQICRRKEKKKKKDESSRIPHGQFF